MERRKYLFLIKSRYREVPGLYRILLSDGSVIWLNSDSRLISGKFALEERRVRISGEAF